MNLGEVFYRQMLRERNVEAIVDGDTRRTYAQWYEDICAVAGGLKQSGIKPGARKPTEAPDYSAGCE